MFDPRADILDEFDSNRIGFTGGKTNITEYVELTIRERNPTGTREHKAYKGIIILEPPVAVKPMERAIKGSNFLLKRDA